MKTLLLFALALFPFASAGMYRFDAEHRRTPKALAQKMREQLFASKPHAKGMRPAKEPAASNPLPLEEYYDYMLLGNVSIGTPPQNFSINFEFWNMRDLFVIATGVIEDPPDDYADPCDTNSTSTDCAPIATRKHLYDSGASTTYVADPTNSVFNASWHSGNGTFATDTLNIAGLPLRMTFGALTEISYEFDHDKPDGYLGLSPKNSSNGIPTVQQQLLANNNNLDAPLITLKSFRNISQGLGDYSGNVQILIGSNQLDGCNASGWVTHQRDGQNAYETFFGRFRATSIGFDSPNPKCADNFAVKRAVQIVDFFTPTYTSIQVMQVFVDASGATFDDTYGGYTVDCALVAKAHDVNIQLADGTAITLHGRDYIIPYTDEEGQTTCMLNVHGNYDENDTDHDWNEIELGQQYLNNRCYSVNPNDGTVGLTDVVIEQ